MDSNRGEGTPIVSTAEILRDHQRARSIVLNEGRLELLTELERYLDGVDRRSLSRVLRTWMERKREALEQKRKALLERKGG